MVKIAGFFTGLIITNYSKKTFYHLLSPILEGDTHYDQCSAGYTAQTNCLACLPQRRTLAEGVNVSGTSFWHGGMHGMNPKICTISEANPLYM